MQQIILTPLETTTEKLCKAFLYFHQKSVLAFQIFGKYLIHHSAHTETQFFTDYQRTRNNIVYFMG